MASVNNEAQAKEPAELIGIIAERLLSVSAIIKRCDRHLERRLRPNPQKTRYRPPEVENSIFGNLPDPTGTQARLTRLYRQAQAIPHFSIVYEQRRTTSTLVSGFRSLGQAIERLGYQIVDEIGNLTTSLGSRLDSLEKSLESSATAAAEQSVALRTKLQSAVRSGETLSSQLHEDAEAHSETERRALRMLDNIQHRRKPSIFDRP